MPDTPPEGQQLLPPPASIPAPQGVNLEAIVRSLATSSNETLIQEIQNQRNEVPLVTLVLNRYANYFLNPTLVRPLFEILEAIGKQDALDLYLVSTGGIAEVPWHIVSLLRSYAKRLGVIVPEHAYSGATHIAIAADELVMLELSSLGSVDPSRGHPLLPTDAKGNPIQASIQDFNHMMSFASSPLGRLSRNNSNVREIIVELFKYVNPLAMGAIDQSNQLSRLITRKVLATRINKLGKKRIRDVEKKLAGEYFSHSFPISRNEVETELKLPVTIPTAELKKAIWDLNMYYDSLFKSQMLVQNANPQLSLSVRYLGFIDSQKSRRIIYGVFGPDGKAITEIIV